jgi:nucleotide-binding universal stress UspA family protein
MEYKSILVNLDIDEPVGPTVSAAVDLARRFGAELIGVCAAQVPLSVAAHRGGILAVEAWQQMRQDIESRIGEIHTEFGRLTDGNVSALWRDSLVDPSHAVVEAARAADLVLLGASRGASTGDAFRTADPKAIVLRAGRPLLVLGNGADAVKASRICVAWKDTREARRAVVDALPLVNVAIDEVEWARRGVADVVAFLGRHGVRAKHELIESAEESTSLLAYAQEFNADLMVSGAYGRSRLQEWVFGGMTRPLLDATWMHRFISS